MTWTKYIRVYSSLSLYIISKFGFFLAIFFLMTSSNGTIFRVTGPLCGNSPVNGEFPAWRPVTQSFGVFFDLHLNKRLSKQSRRWWFKTPSRSYDVIVIFIIQTHSFSSMSYKWLLVSCFCRFIRYSYIFELPSCCQWRVWLLFGKTPQYILAYA